MDEIELIATFDTEETARQVSKALNHWFAWIMEGDSEDEPEFFEDFGISSDEYALDRDSDTDWSDTPVARAAGNRVMITFDSSNAIDTLEELLEALGAYDVTLAGEED